MTSSNLAHSDSGDHEFWAGLCGAKGEPFRRFVHRADQLRAVPAAVRFISAEPLLGPLVPGAGCYCFANLQRAPHAWPDGHDGPTLSLEAIDWLIVGGESGHADVAARPCVVLDPFSGAGTTVMEALRHGRSAIGVELNPEYAALARRRIHNDAPLLNAAAETEVTVDAA